VEVLTRRQARRLSFVILTLVVSLPSRAFGQGDADAQRNERPGPQWGISVWGLSYHIDERMEYDAINWGLGLRRYARPDWRWLGRNEWNRLFLEADALRNSNGGLAVPLSAGVEYEITALPAQCRLFAVGALSVAYYRKPALNRTEVKYGPVPGLAIGCGRFVTNVTVVLSPSSQIIAAVAGSLTVVF
jgi:hypothetical protein